MAATVVRGLLEPGSNPLRGFGNLNIDAWRVVRRSPILFVLIPIVAWYPPDLLVEWLVSHGEGFWTQFRLYTRLQELVNLFVGSWVAAMTLSGVRQLSETGAISVRRSIVEGTRQYPRFLATAWATLWRVFLGFLALFVPGVVLMVRYALAFPAAAFEEVGGVKAIQSSSTRVSRRWTRMAAIGAGFLLVYWPWGWALDFLVPSNSIPLAAVGGAVLNFVTVLSCIWLALIYIDTTGNRAIPPPVGAVATRAEDGAVRSTTPRGRKRLAATVLLGLAALAVTAHIDFERPVFEGTRMSFGPDQIYELYYDDDVTPEQAWLMCGLLMDAGLFEGEPLALRMGSDDRSHYIYVPTEEEWLSDSEMMEWLDQLEDYLSETMEKRTRIVFLLPAFSGLRQLPLDRVIARMNMDETKQRRQRQIARFLRGDETGENVSILETAGSNNNVSQWIEVWKESCGELWPWSFLMEDSRIVELNPEDATEFPWMTNDEASMALRSTMDWSPEKDFGLNMFVHRFTEENGVWRALLTGTGQSVYLFRAADGRGWPVLEVESPTLVHATGWVGERSFVVLGVESGGEGEYLCIWRITLNDEFAVQERHRGQLVALPQKAALEERWSQWLESKYAGFEWE
jgi:hypothetical protein